MNNTFPNQIKTHLPESSWPWVIAALRQDQLVWETLIANETMLNTPAVADHTPESWNPAWVVFQCLGWPIPEPNAALSVGLRQRAFQTYEVVTQRRKAVDIELSPIAQAALLALALRESLRLSGKWSNLIEELTLASEDTWRTPLACLYGLLEQPVELLRALLIPGAPPSIHKLALHALLCNPLAPESQAELIKVLMASLPISDGLSLLNQLYKCRPVLANQVAQSMDFSLRTGEQVLPLSNLVANYQSTEIALIAGNPIAAKSAIDQALDNTRLIQAKLYSQIAQISDTPLGFWQKAFESAPEQPGYRSRLALAFIDANNLTEARAILDPSENPGHPDLFYAAARLAQLSGELDQARQYASQALTALENQFDKLSDSHETLPPRTLELSRFLLEIQLPSAAIRAARLAILERTDDPERFVLLGQAQTTTKQPLQAAEAYQLAVLLAPQRIDLHRLLAENLEAAGEFVQALEERKNVASADTAIPNDQYALIDCAIKNQQPAYTIEICDRLLRQNPADGMAHTLLGEALAAQNDWQTAKDHFIQASELMPNLPRPWLSLASAYNQNDEPEKAFETLRIASQAIPGSAQVHLALGEQYLSENSPTQALSAFQRANEIEAQNIPIALRYGQTLHQLGHLPLAHQVLQQAYKQDPSNPEVAHIYARILLGQEDPQSALPPLETVIASNPGDPEPFVDYAQAILLTHGAPTKATQAIRHALSLNPVHSEANALLGEALAAEQDYTGSLLAYQAALETPLVYSDERRARLSFGLGSVALRLGKIEIAIASLLEAVQLDQQNYRPHCQLADAYQIIKLIPDAYQAAREALHLAGDDLPVMIWYAEKMLALAENGSSTGNGTAQVSIQSDELRLQASQILARAAEIASTQPEMLLCIATLQIKAGDNTPAANNLRQIAKISTATPVELQQAAKILIDQYDGDGAVLCLEKALKVEQENEANKEFRISLLTQLAQAYQLANSLELALLVLEKAVVLAPQAAGLCHKKASLLIELGQIEAALAFIEEALHHLPDPSLHHLAAYILRTQGKLLEALKHAETGAQILANDDNGEYSPGQQLSTLLAAELAQAILQPDKAGQILQTQALKFKDQKHPLISQYDILWAEIALSENRESEAANLLGKALIDSGSRSPRSLALQARLAARRGDLPTGLDRFQAAIQLLDEYDPGNNDSACADRKKQSGEMHISKPLSLQSILYPLTEAALELKLWGIALRLAQKAVQIAPAEPLAHLYLVRVLVQRAEFQNLCSVADVIHHAPGAIALSEGTRHAVEQTIQNLAGLCDNYSQESLPPIIPVLAHWQIRGEAVFSPSEKTALALNDWAKQNPHPDILEASFAALRRIGNLNLQPSVPQEHPSAAILTQLALSIEGDQPQEALKMLQLAILNEPARNYRYAIRNYLLARIADNLKSSMASSAIQTAIAILPDEPRWRAMAAKIYLASGDKNSAIQHLEQAIQLEPRHIEHHLALGRLYLQDAGPNNVEAGSQAVKCMERATRITPDHSEAWLVLAEAHRIAGNLEQAAAAAETAATLAPDQIASHLMLAGISMQSGQFQAAHDHALAARRIQPASQEAAVFLAHSLQELDRPAEALDIIDEAIPETEQTLALKLERILLLRRAKGNETALIAATELSQVYPDEPAVLAILAEAQAQAGQDGIAVGTAQKAILLGENLPIVQQARLRLLLGSVLRLTGQLDQAVHHLDEAIHLEPNQIDAYLELGHAHQDRRQQAQALLMYRKAATIAPTDPRPYLMAGLALKDGKDYIESESMLHRAADLAPNDLTIRRQLAAVIAINLVHSPRRTVQADPL